AGRVGRHTRESHQPGNRSSGRDEHRVLLIWRAELAHIERLHGRSVRRLALLAVARERGWRDRGAERRRVFGWDAAEPLRSPVGLRVTVPTTEQMGTDPLTGLDPLQVSTA